MNLYRLKERSFSIYREVEEIKVILYNIELSYGLHIQSRSNFLLYKYKDLLFKF